MKIFGFIVFCTGCAIHSVGVGIIGLLLYEAGGTAWIAAAWSDSSGKDDDHGS